MYGPVQENKGMGILKMINTAVSAFGYVLTILATALLILLIIDSVWIHKILNNTNNMTLTCPVPIFNGTVEFNGTLVCNTTSSSNLIVNETACSSNQYQIRSNKPCGRLLYDTVNHICVPASQPDNTPCSHDCFGSAPTPVCAGGYCRGGCAGACETSDNCTKAYEITGDLEAIYSGNIQVVSTCRKYDSGGGSIITPPSAADPTQFGNPVVGYFTYQSANISTPGLGYCVYTVSIERYINSPTPYGNVNETFSTSDNFCRSLYGTSTLVPLVKPNTGNQCMQAMSGHGYITNISPSSPYSMKATYVCDFAHMCSARRSGSSSLSL